RRDRLSPASLVIGGSAGRAVRRPPPRLARRCDTRADARRGACHNTSDRGVAPSLRVADQWPEPERRHRAHPDDRRARASRAAHHAAGGRVSEPIAPFRERYRKALADGQLRRGLLNFQRAWQESRRVAFEHLEEHAALGVPAASFGAQRKRLADAKNAALDDRADQLARFKAAAEAAGAVVYESTSAQDAVRYV